MVLEWIKWTNIKQLENVSGFLSLKKPKHSNELYQFFKEEWSNTQMNSCLRLTSLQLVRDVCLYVPTKENPPLTQMRCPILHFLKTLKLFALAIPPQKRKVQTWSRFAFHTQEFIYSGIQTPNIA